MNGIATTGFASWFTSLNPQVQGAAIAATATVISVFLTAALGFFGFKHARSVVKDTIEGHSKKTKDERRFAVYEDAIKYLLRLTRLRPENYNFWPEVSGWPAEPEIPAAEQADIEALVAAWASDEIRGLWKKMQDDDHGTEVARDHLRFLRGETDLVAADPIPPEKIEEAANRVNACSHAAHRQRQAVIEVIRAQLA